MLSEEVRDIIRRVTPPLEELDGLAFAILFGSAATGSLRPFSDVDVAIHAPQTLDILRLGRLAGDLEEACGRAVDVLELRGLPDRNPELAFTVVESGVPFLVRDEEAFVRFKKYTFLYYLDTEHLRTVTRAALLERARAGKLGRAHDAG